MRKRLLLLRGTLGYTNIALFFAACYFLPLATATTFTFLSPLIVALLSPWLLRETPSPAVAVITPLCIGGVVLVTQPPELFGSAAKGLSAVGLAIGLLQPFFLASVKVCGRLGTLLRTAASHSNRGLHARGPTSRLPMHALYLTLAIHYIQPRCPPHHAAVLQHTL